jgi:hypothetical protein
VGVVQGEAEGQWLLLSSNHAGAVQEARLTAEQLADAATLAAGRIDRRIAA